ncbi:hypothetical protein OK074_7319 [Actinobacteria bacterium OK074]|nr:hypothetical protein OK074_7319 [Actinobacteria bacterium OK074]
MSPRQPRTARSGVDLRVLRAAVFAAVCVVLAAAGHGLASCAAVPPWTLAAGFLTVFGVATALAGRERTLPGIVVVLAVGQTALHTLFGLGQHAAGVAGASGTSMAGMPGMSATGTDATLVARAARLLCGASAATLSPARAQRILTEARLGTGTSPHASDALSSTAGSSASALPSVLPSLPMLLGHVLAAVAAGWMLRRGDMALLRLMRLSAGIAEGAPVRALRAALTLVRALLAGLPGAPDARPRALCTAPPVPPKPRTSALQHTVIRRGPPLPAAPALAL